MSSEFDQQVWEAEQVRCVRCYADPGVRCRNMLTGEPMRAAHWQRVRDAGASVPTLRAVPDGQPGRAQPMEDGSDD